MTAPRLVLMEARSVRFGYPHRADFLGPVSFTMERGQCWGIVGPNGAGKSTMVRLIAGLLAPRLGEVRYLGESISNISARSRARHIGFLPQRTPDCTDSTVRDVVLMGRYGRLGLLKRQVA